jgi:uncharacterized protein (UPF0335 family)
MSVSDPSIDTIITGAGQTRLRTIVERIERLEEDKAVVTNDIKEVYAEAKGEGFDVKILRKLVAERKKDPAKRDEEEAILDLYRSAVEGRLPMDLPVQHKPRPDGARELQKAFVSVVDTALNNGEAQTAVNAKVAEHYLAEATAFVRGLGRGFTAEEVETRFSWTRKLAASIIDMMEGAGIVTAPDRNGYRNILPGEAAA